MPMKKFLFLLTFFSLFAFNPDSVIATEQPDDPGITQCDLTPEFTEVTPSLDGSYICDQLSSSEAVSLTGITIYYPDILYHPLRSKGVPVIDAYNRSLNTSKPQVTCKAMTLNHYGQRYKPVSRSNTHKTFTREV